MVQREVTAEQGRPGRLHKLKGHLLVQLNHWMRQLDKYSGLLIEPVIDGVLKATLKSLITI